MHRRLGTGRFAVLRLVGLVTAVAVCSLRVFSLADAQSSAGRSAQTRQAVVVIPGGQQPDGKKIFATTCAACHQANGEGLDGTYPPLVGSEWVTGDEGKLVRIILHGLTGPVEVAGESYEGLMPGWEAMLKDSEIAAVATYSRSAWGNEGFPVVTAKVAQIRTATASRKTPWTAAELAQIVTPAAKK
jgi:mono/diheme cytochrome c family protein